MRPFTSQTVEGHAAATLAGMSLLARYGDLLRTDGVARALLFSIIGRLSLGMAGLGIVLQVRAETGSYASAGAVSAAYALAFAVGAPWLARSADRRGPVRVLLRCAVAHPAAMVTLAGLTATDASLAVLMPVAALAGLSFPPLGAVMRALWTELASGRQLVTAYSLESVAIEVCFVLGPGLTALCVATSGPLTALLVSAGFALIGGIGLGSSAAVGAVRPHPTAVHSMVGPLSAPAVRALLFTVLFIGVGFGAIEVAMPAFTEEVGSGAAAAGILLAVWSLGSMVGGLLYGGLALTAPAQRQLPWLVTALAAAGSLPLLAGTPVLMGAALFVYGMTIAPFFACNSLLLGAAAPAGTTTEAFAWHTSMIFGGLAIGTAAAGALADARGAGLALAVLAVAGVLTFGTSLAGRSRLSPG